MLTLHDLTVCVGASDGGTATTILDSLSLTVPAGGVHAIMGPNGAGKSTLSHVLTGRDGYEVIGGKAKLNGVDILDMTPEERAVKGLFLSFQYPVEIPGVPVMTFVRTAMNAQRKARGEPEISAPDFIRLANEVATVLKLEADMLKRPLNIGFSGGEKKRMEIFQLLMLKPLFAILDETDSGLDIDALRTVADGVNTLRDPARAILIITHYKRLLDYVKPDKVHILAKGRIVKTGGPELAAVLEREGYDGLLSEANS